MVKNIGGFFEEETLYQYSTPFHSNEAVKLVNGRSALLLLLISTNPPKIKVPFYSCDSLLQPIQQLKIRYEYYAINENFLPEITDIEKDDFFILINYFGLLENSLLEWVQKTGITNFVIDNTQSFFSKPNGYMSFNSVRKFFGVTDGAYLFAKDIVFQMTLSEIDFDDAFLSLRKNGDLAEGYELYKKNETSQPCGLYKMSAATEDILNRINYQDIMQKRIMNFDRLHSALASINSLNYVYRNNNIPFTYPFIPCKPFDKILLYNKGIFFPSLWPEVLVRQNQKFNLERKLSTELIPLPIDHRYSEEDMNYIIKNILTLLQ